MNPIPDRNETKFHPLQPAAKPDPRWRASSGPQEEESLRNSIRVLRKRKYVVLWSILGSVTVSILICLFMKPQYTATATMLVDKQNSGLDMEGISGLASAVGGSDELKDDLQTHMTLLESPTTILQVAKDLNLTSYKPYKVQPGLATLLHPSLKREMGLPLSEASATRERLVKIISDRDDVNVTQDTRLITIAYRDYDPNRASAIANDFVDRYIHEYLETKFRATAEASDWLTGQLNTLKAQVQRTQQALSDYQRKTGLSVLMLGLSGASSGSGGSSGAGTSMAGGPHIPAVDRLAALNAEVTGAEADRISKEAIYRLTQSESPEVVLGLNSTSLASAGGSSVLSQGGGLIVLQGLRVQQSALQEQYEDYLSKYGSKNPHLLEMQAQMAGLDRAIQAEMGRIRERAKNDYELAKKAENTIKQSYKGQEEIVNKLNDSTVQLELLESDAIQSSVLYNDLYSKLQEANIEAGVQATNLSNVDPARPPYSQSRPLWLAYPAIALGVGLLVGIGAAFVREHLDDSIVTPDQVEEAAWFPVLSYVPMTVEKHRGSSKLAPPDKAADASPLVSNPRTSAAEAYRSLRTAIQLSTADVTLRTVLVTSPLGGDGKTTTAYNTAIAFAQNGARVLLIDADMHKPRMHALFGIRRSPGLTDVLTGGAPLTDAAKQHAAVATLFLLPAGTMPPNPADLLGSKQVEILLEDALKQFDIIIIDSPPVLMVTDALILSTKVDGTVLVVRSGKTTKMVLRRASEILYRSSGRKLGILINAVDTRSVEYYYSYGYYSDDKYYGEEA